MRHLRRLARSVSGRLIFILLIVLIPIFLAQAGLYVHRLQEQQARAYRADLDIARATAIAFDAYMKDVLRQELLIGIVLTSPPRPHDQANKILGASAGTYASIREFFWVEPGGQVAASSNPQIIGVDVRERDYFQQIERGQEWVVSDLLQALVGGDPVFVVARGVRDDRGTLQGMVGATILAPKLGTLALPLELSGQRAINILDRQGKLVYLRPERELTWEQRGLLSDNLLVQRALAGQEATGALGSLIDSLERMGAVVPVRTIGWAISASVPVSEAAAPFLQDLYTEVAILLIVAGLSSLAAVIISRTITVPIVRVEQQAQAMAGGDLSSRVQAAGPAELESLAASFNQMAEKIQERTVHLEASIKELEAFSYSVSHDLRTPLRSIDGFSQALLEDYGELLDSQGKDYLQRVRAASQRMGRLIDDMLMLSRVTRREMSFQRVNLSALADRVARTLQATEPERRVEFVIQPGLVVRGDKELLKIVMESLLGNAWKFTSTRTSGKIEFGMTEHGGKKAYYVRDNGAGFDMAYVGKLFGAFQRLHAPTEYPGTGIGLATVQRIIHRHGGHVWAEGAADQGATFYFTL